TRLMEEGSGMREGQGRRFGVTYVFVLFAILAGIAGIVSRGFGTVIPGGGPAKSDCYVVLDTQGTRAATSSKLLECTDGDRTCDMDGACNNVCEIKVRLCINQTDLQGCAAPSGLSTLKFASRPATFTLNTPARLEGSACSSFVDANVP